MIASRVIYPPNTTHHDPHMRSTSPVMASSPPTRIRTSGIFTRRLSLTAASVASSSLFGSSPPPASSMYQQSSFFRSSTNLSSSGSNTAIATPSRSNVASSPALAPTPSGRQRTRSTSHPPPPKYKTYRTPQLRISLQDTVGNLVLSPPVMVPGESIRGQIHLELPKATPVHSIEVCLTGTVTALDGTRLGSMKTVTILEEYKTVATASVTNARTNTTRRHTTPAPVVTTSPAEDSTPPTATAREQRRGSLVSDSAFQDRARSPTQSAQSAVAVSSTAVAVAAAAAATMAATGNLRRLSTELMSRTMSMPYYSTAQNASTLSLNRPVSPTPADLRGRRTSFSANVDMPIGGFSALSRAFERNNMSMINISTINQYSFDGPLDDPSEPEAPSYDPPNYDRIFTPSRRSLSNSSTCRDVVAPSPPPEPSSTNAETTGRVPSASTSAPAPSASPASSIANGTASERSSQDVTRESIQAPAPAPEPEPKAVLMQPGNYVIPFSIRIPANTTMSLPGSFSDPVGSISYQLKAVMKQILPNTDPYNPKALLVEPTFSSATQVIKLIPMNDPTFMPLYSIPYETESVRANVGHWVWSTGFMEAHAWVPKQGYRPGRMIPLVIHIVNHSDARQVVVETTLCKCLHYGTGLSKVRAMGIAGQGYRMDPTLVEPEEVPASTVVPERDRRRMSRAANRPSRNSQPGQESMPSPPASPPQSNFFPSTPSSDGGDSPNGSVHGSRMTSPGSMASISSQWESFQSSGNHVSNNSGESYDSEARSSMASPTPSVASSQAPLPIIQHLREKMSKSRTMINCSLAVDREIQKTIMVPVPLTAGYSILNAPLLEVSYEIVVKIRAEKVYSRGLRLEVPIVVVVPEEGDLEEEEEMLNAGISPDYTLAFSGDEYDFGSQGECPPYEATTTSTRRRSRR